MSQTNTNNNNISSNTNPNRISGRGGRDQGGPGSRNRGDCSSCHRNNSIAKYSFEEKMKDSSISKLTVIETGYQAIQYKRVIDTPPYYVQIKTTKVLMMYFGKKST